MTENTSPWDGETPIPMSCEDVPRPNDGAWVDPCDQDGTPQVPPTTVAQSAPPVDVCHEDEPCWDCSTMGNLMCGPPTTEAVILVPARDALPETGVDISAPIFGLGVILTTLGTCLVLWARGRS